MVAGDFNGWSHDATPHDSARRWKSISVSVEMTEGVHLYKFLVDGKWANDPHSDLNWKSRMDSAGKIRPFWSARMRRRFPPPPPGRIVAELLRHDLTDVRNRNVVSPQQLRLGFRAQAGNIQRAAILWSSDGTVPGKRQEMYPVAPAFGFEDFAGL